MPIYLNNAQDLPAEVSLEIEKWPGEPSLAVVGQAGLLACKDAGHIYRFASITKLLTALTILSAMSEGTVSLDDRVGPPGSTLLHLLSHASGLGFSDDQIRSPAGKRRIYSNYGIDVAAEHLSSRTGKDFGEEMRGRVLDPLGMHHTVLAERPSQGCEGTIRDLALLAGELLKPSVLPESSIQALSSLAYPDLAGFLPGFGHQEQNDWGAGAEIRGHKSPHWMSPDNSPETFGHFGMAGSFLWVDRAAGLACAALSTVNFGEWAPALWPSTSTAVLRNYASSRNSGAASAVPTGEAGR